MLDARDLLGSQTLHGFVCEHGRGAQIRQVVGDDDAVACATNKQTDKDMRSQHTTCSSVHEDGRQSLFVFESEIPVSHCHKRDQP